MIKIEADIIFKIVTDVKLTQKEEEKKYPSTRIAIGIGVWKKE